MQDETTTRSPTTESPYAAEQMINADKLAKMLGVSRRTLWRLLSAGKLIPPVRIGGSTRWRTDDVRRWIDDGCQPPEA
jgi:excisionase family DNA binding protein